MEVLGGVLEAFGGVLEGLDGVNKKKNVSLNFILHILFDVLLGNNTLFMITLFDLLDTIVVVQTRPRPSQNRPLCLTIVGIHLWRIWQSGNDLARTWQRLGMSERETETKKLFCMFLRASWRLLEVFWRNLMASWRPCWTKIAPR